MTPEVFATFQNKLKVGNRRGVHLNALPANSRYKFDIARLSAIVPTLPQQFVTELMSVRNVKFSFSIENSKKNEKEEALLQKIVSSVENLIFQNEVIWAEKGVNTLGFGYPILLRRDSNDGQLTAAPVLIWQIKMKPTSQMNTWELSRNEDDPIYLNEVLINHLQNDSGISLKPIPDEMLEDGIIDANELYTLCTDLLQQLKVEQSLDFLTDDKAAIAVLKTKQEYEALLPNRGDALIEKCGILSLFEVQKQNIIADYQCLITQFKPEEFAANDTFQTLTSVPTDPSQQSILEQLRQQRKILIQGPPGTGKSQTLTALLINALQNKQKTLVVCEKQTALEVLYNALQQKGLGNYCTMIKDPITDRRLIVEAVRNIIDSQDFRKPSSNVSEILVDKQVAAMQEHKRYINAIHEKLNKVLIAGQTWTDIVAAMMQHEPQAEKLNLTGLHFAFTDEEWQTLTPLWEQGQRLYEAFKPYKASDFFNPVTLTAQNLFTTQQLLAEAFQQYEQQAQAIGDTVENYRKYYHQKRQEEFDTQLQELTAYHNEYDLLTAMLPENSEVYQPEKTAGFFYKLASVFSGAKKKVLRTQERLIAISTAVKAMSTHPNLQPVDITANLYHNKSVITDYLQRIVALQANFDEHISEDFAALNLLSFNNPAFADVSLQTLQSQVQQLKTQLTNDKWLKRTSWGNTFAEFSKALQEVVSTYKQYQADAAHPLKLIYEWQQWYLSLTAFQQQCVQLLQSVTHWEASLLMAYYPLLLQHHADASLNFSAHHYSDLDTLLKDFAATQQQFIENYWNEQQRLAVKAFEDSHNELTVANLYNKRKSEKHNRLPLRQIAMHDVNLFTNFFPIVLTTPDACCNLFEGKNFYFDNVVFDEASQLKLEDNLPAMLKGKTVVIAGDEHQMPPSNYFSKVFDGTAEDEDDDESEGEVISYKDAMLNIESLLDYALEYQFNKNHLDFHYRSKHPHLIDFSNHAFYNARLRPLPNTKAFTPIVFKQVDGVFDEHINKEEAAEVLRLLEELPARADGSYPSVGIATFNITQRNYIRKQLLQKQNDPANKAFREKIAALEAAGLFIKNLENIQGDERDVIILSVTYGKKKDGKFVQAFGPLNHTKGYKLLNVIITRAKEQIYVCNSIPQEIYAAYKDALAQEGANNRRAVLYAYLAYSKAVSDNNESARQEILAELDRYGHKHNNTAHRAESHFKNEVYKKLKAQHPDSDITQDYHFGGYTIDVLLRPENNQPAVAVECLSKPLYAGELAYLEDLHKEKILTAAGFQYKRVWAHEMMR